MIDGQSIKLAELKTIRLTLLSPSVIMYKVSDSNNYKAHNKQEALLHLSSLMPASQRKMNVLLLNSTFLKSTFLLPCLSFPVLAIMPFTNFLLYDVVQ